MTYVWTVIGAGPAGIAAVGKLLDHGIAGKDIAWIDPAFAAGDIGAKWRSVSSNTQVGLFLSYLNGADAFRFSAAPPMPLTEIDPDETCALALVADPETDLFARLPHGDGQTILREALLVADHNAYHLGQLIVVRRLLDAWEE